MFSPHADGDSVMRILAIFQYINIKIVHADSASSTSSRFSRSLLNFKKTFSISNTYLYLASVSDEPGVLKSGHTNSKCNWTSPSTPLGLFVCQRCSRSFKHTSSFYRHLRYECGVEPRFQCPVCNMKFKQKYNMIVHKRRHRF